MVREKCEYTWQVASRNELKVLYSPEFPKKKSVFKWDIVLDSRHDKWGINLRVKAAPRGDIVVNYSVKCHYVTKRLEIKKLTDNFYFENYGNACNMSVIFQHSIAPEHQQFWKGIILFVESLHINISAYYICQSLDQELSTTHSSISFLELTGSVYTKSLLEVIEADPEFCDIKIKVQETELEAHKAILAAVSPVFRAEITNNLLERTSGYVIIKDLSVETVRSMLKFIYNGYVELIDYLEAIELLKVSDIYDIQHLRKYCAEYLKGKINPDNVIKILVAAEVTNTTDLRETAMHLFEVFCVTYKAEDFKEMLEVRPDMLPLLLEKLSAVRLKQIERLMSIRDN